MIGGRILQIASPEVIYKDPDHIEVASFIGSPKINLLPGKMAQGGSLFHAGRNLFAGFSGPERDITIGIRPEHLLLSTEGHQESIPLLLHRLEFLGSEVIAHLIDQTDGRALIARLEPHEAHYLSGNTELHASASADHMLVFETDGSRVRAQAANLREAASYAS
jgi:multiple sugar transport system ATP-binding protein